MGQLIAPMCGIPGCSIIHFRMGKEGRRTSIVLLRMQCHLIKPRTCTHIQMINFLRGWGRPPQFNPQPVGIFTGL